MRDSPLRRRRQQRNQQFAVRPRKKIRTDLQGRKRWLAATPLHGTEITGPPDSLLAGPPVYEPVLLAASERDFACYLGIIPIRGRIFSRQARNLRVSAMRSEVPWLGSPGLSNSMEQ